MERPIWAPWRMEYIAGPKPPGCIFCEFPAAPEASDRANLVVHRSAHSFTCLNRYPYNSGHVMVIPYAHVSDPAALARDAWADLQDELRRAIAVLQATYRPEGLNVGMNLGKAAGAGIEPHLHWHVVPRWVGDNNFMPVIADRRVVPEALDAAWEKLRAGFQAAAP
ncbi:MAG TPA: HIT domain-containing protein [Anaeromyxobacter sp.]|nr:HIT domain-containing protein [Anaeromyxobacter sp.]